MLVRNLVRPVVRPLIRGITDAIGADPDLAFHALNLVAAGSPDITIGTGVLTEARTSIIYLPDDAGIWRPFTSSVPGKVFANGKWWLYGGPAGTNEITFSRNLANAAWTETGMDVAAFDAVGLEGIANTASTLTDDDGASREYVSESITIPDDSNTHVLRVFIEKDADETRFPEFELALAAGTTQNLLLGFNTSTGASAVRSSIGTVAHEVIDRGLFWEILLSVQNNSTGNIAAAIRVVPALGTTIAVADVAAVGSIIVGNVEFHENKTIAQVRGTTPIFTSGSTVTVDATDLSFDDANHADLEGAYFCEFKNVGMASGTEGGLLGIGSSGRLLYAGDSSSLRSFDGSLFTQSPAITLAADDVEYSVGLAYGNSLYRLNIDAVWGTAQTYDGSYDNVLNELATLTSKSFDSAPVSVMLLRNLRRYDLPYVDAQAKIDQLMA